MCGIVGYAGRDTVPFAGLSELRAMCDAIRHRGPDDAGYFTDHDVGLGMRRLSIIDLAGGHQPIGNEDGTIQVVFNGEIYNYAELRHSLVTAGHRFSTHSDTEVLVHLYEEWGERLVHHLRGMFAFALWDGRRQRLLLARDRLGIKPLYYWTRDDGLVFASELKSLLRLDSFPRRLDPGAIASFLALGYVPDPQCVFEGVRKLEPGHLLRWDRRRGVETYRYWSPVVPEDPTVDEVTAVREIRRLLSESIRYRLIADVPLGAFLSGGLDSSAVVAEMSRQMDRPVRTFSIGFDESSFNEAPHAAAVARALGTEHHELVLRPDVDPMIEEVATAFDEPFADSSAIPTLLVSRLAAREVKVVLSGDGGDETFGGYTRYVEMLRRNVPLPRAGRALLARVARSLPHSALGRNRLLELSRTPPGRYAGTVAYPLAEWEGGIAAPALAAAAPGMDELLAPWFEQAAGRDFPTRMMLVDLLSYLPGDILTKVDRMSMAASLEARVPLLDHHLVEFAVSIPSRLKLSRRGGKRIFAEAVRGLVPDSVLHRPKRGFAVPLSRWFRVELRHRVIGLLDARSPLYEHAGYAAARRIVGEHLSGRRDHSTLLWRLLVLQIWLESVGRVPPAGAPAGSVSLTAT